MMGKCKTIKGNKGMKYGGKVKKMKCGGKVKKK